MKYIMNTREIPRPKPKGFPKDSGYILRYMPTQVIILGLQNLLVNPFVQLNTNYLFVLAKLVKLSFASKPHDFGSLSNC